MGGYSIRESDMRSYYSSRPSIKSARNVQEVCREDYMADEFDPAKMKLPREARDSALSQKSRGIILCGIL